MKFLCLACDQVMDFADRRLPGDGTMAAVFGCPTCGREIAMLANPMETQLVSSMGVKVGGREVPEQPMELVRSSLADGREDAFDDADAPDTTTAGAGAAGGRIVWSDDALDRLGNVPSFVRGMVKRIYADYARERGIARITPDVMDTARTELGLEGM
ncbi:MAG TPA: PCP reductase family protein [Longimicrobiales bacterium]|nr:PCP reductase family protein [Longimicrobiales bacterium]